MGDRGTGGCRQPPKFPQSWRRHCPAGCVPPPSPAPTGTGCRIRPAWDAGTGNGPVGGCPSPLVGRSHAGGAGVPRYPPGSSSQSPVGPRSAFPARTWLPLATATTGTAVPGVGGCVPWVSPQPWWPCQRVRVPPKKKPGPCRHHGWATPLPTGHRAGPLCHEPCAGGTRWDAVAPVARVVPMPPGSRRGDGVTAEPQPGAGVARQPWPVTGAGRPPPRP